MLWSRQVTEVVGHIMGVRKPWRRHVAPRRTPGTVQRALLDGPKGQNLSLGPKKIFLLIRWSQSTRRSLSLKGLVKKVYRAFKMSVGVLVGFSFVALYSAHCTESFSQRIRYVARYAR